MARGSNPYATVPTTNLSAITTVSFMQKQAKQDALFEKQIQQ